MTPTLTINWGLRSYYYMDCFDIASSFREEYTYFEMH